jgi:hypothetical protein
MILGQLARNAGRESIVHCENRIERRKKPLTRFFVVRKFSFQKGGTSAMATKKAPAKKAAAKKPAAKKTTKKK